ncbi:4'-phosphopantetheinyl transferase family protein [Kurthia massiliensis]|uniref:4'-phosphopantetheinyl transferase family protein n=1 Tax=Kurthia massiliensis TaxID=1033739 RepID=UPI000289622E|nr:4'-phosphopantetheinyl transferase superfamily protein [Kurthia massiliensis]
MTIVYTSHVSEWTAQDYQWMLQCLPMERVEKAKRFKASIDRQSSLLAGLMIQQLIGPTIAYTTLGKPYCPVSETHFSVAHSDGFVVVAISDQAIGVDCEHDKTPAIADIVSLFHPFEQVGIRSGRTSFSDIWTMKEAYGKWCGCGLNYDLSTMYLARNRLYTGHIRLKPYIYHTVLASFTITVCCTQSKRPQYEHFKRSVTYATSFNGNIN